MNDRNPQKTDHMNQLADFRDNVLRKDPRLKFLFLELTYCSSNLAFFGELSILSGVGERGTGDPKEHG